MVIILLCKVVNGRAEQRGGSSQPDSNEVIGIHVQFIIGDLLPSCPSVCQASTVFRSRVSMISARTARIRRSRWCSIGCRSFRVFLDLLADLQLTEGYFLEFLCKTEKEPEPVITEDQWVLALSLTNNTRLKGAK